FPWTPHNFHTRCSGQVFHRDNGEAECGSKNADPGHSPQEFWEDGDKANKAKPSQDATDDPCNASPERAEVGDARRKTPPQKTAHDSPTEGSENDVLHQAGAQVDTVNGLSDRARN